VGIFIFYTEKTAIFLDLKKYTELEVDGKPVGECLKQSTYARTQRQVENILLPAAHAIGGGRIKTKLSRCDSERD